MEALERIINQVKSSKDIPLNNESNYECFECKDTTWLKAETGFRRCSCYETDLISRLWENFGVSIKDIKFLRDYEGYNDLTKKAKNKATEYIKNYEEIKNSDENSFALLGQPGSGKTHIILAIGKALIDKKYKVVYMPYLEAIKELKNLTMLSEDYERVARRYKQADILIIDDFFKDKVKNGEVKSELTEADMKHIYPIINYRYLNKLPLIISSECDPMMLLALDEALATRILERTGKRFSLTFKGDCNYRLKKFME